MAPRVQIKDCRLITRLFVEGVPQKEISRRTGRSKTSASRIISAFRDERIPVDAKQSGQWKVTEYADDILIVAASFGDPFLTAKEIRDELSLDIFTATILCRLKEAELSNRAAVQKPLLTERKCLQCLYFAQNYQHWAKEEWRIVIFNDEVPFCTRWDQWQWVRRPLNSK